MDDHLCIFLDDRGLSRPIEEIWIPELSVDIVWMTSPGPDDEINLSAGSIPKLELSPADVAALSAEFTDDSGSVIAIFDSLASIVEASNYGLHPRRITIVSYVAEDGVRVAPNVHFNDQDHTRIALLIARGFTLTIQPLPNVTPRPWPGPVTDPKLGTPLHA